ncbi:MAG TPA: hypothetical protein VGX37_00140 [Allosphingosinicella sp.]|jgi:hypothetical protein|nr:hypothetical protein [Allosphingosinicella sp.]
MKRAALLLMALSLPACGLREPLRTAPGQGTPPAPAMARRAPTTEEMLVAPPIARPQRVDELLRRSEERPNDRFDLPPPDVAPGELPTNGGEEPE